MTNILHLPVADAMQVALPFIVGQGRNIEQRIYETRYREINYRDHVPVVTEGAPWAFGTLFRISDWAGQAKILSGAANDVPFVQTSHEQKTRDFFMIGAGWEWNLEEVAQAMMLGVPVQDNKARAATRSVEFLLNSVAMRGSTEKNITGFINDALVTRVDAANTGTGPSTFWANKTVDQILKDINDALGLVRTQSNEVERADSIRIPPDAFRDIATRRLGAGDGTLTLLAYLQQNNIYTAETNQPLNIATIPELATASQDGGGRLVAYRRDPEVVRFHLPMPRQVIPVNQKGLMAWEQATIARTGGTEWRLPKAAVYLDEITAPPV